MVTLAQILSKWLSEWEGGFFVLLIYEFKEMSFSDDQVCQTKPECGRQTLAELMIRPVQRLPSVMLLLKG